MMLLIHLSKEVTLVKADPELHVFDRDEATPRKNHFWLFSWHANGPPKSLWQVFESVSHCTTQIVSFRGELGQFSRPITFIASCIRLSDTIKIIIE